MNRLATVVLIAVTAAVTLPSMGCIVRRERRPAREVVVVHEHDRRR